MDRAEVGFDRAEAAELLVALLVEPLLLLALFGELLRALLCGRSRLDDADFGRTVEVSEPCVTETRSRELELARGWSRTCDLTPSTPSSSLNIALYRN